MAEGAGRDALTSPAIVRDRDPAWDGAATRFGIVGLGRIGRRLATRLPGTANAPALAAVLVRDGAAETARATLGPAVVCTELSAFIARRPDVAVECASAAALAEIGPPLLAAGIDLMPLSLGAFADVAVERRVVEAARAGPGRIEIPPGAIGSLGFLAAAREDGLARVVFRATYPVAAWKRMRPAACSTDFDAIGEPALFFRGSVREALRLFPGHLNVAAGVALAGLGLDRTEAELIADPGIRQAAFEVQALAGPGPIQLRIGGRDAPLDDDPVDYTSFSVMRLLRRRQARIVI